MVAGRTHFHCPSSAGRGTIVVDDSGAPRAWQEALVEKKFSYYLTIE